MSRPEWAKNLKRWDVIQYESLSNWIDAIFITEIVWAKYPVVVVDPVKFNSGELFDFWYLEWDDFRKKDDWSRKNETKCPICKKDREIEIISEDVFKCLTCEHTIYTAFWYKVL